MKFAHRPWVKVLSFLLAILMLLFTAASGVVGILMGGLHFYTESEASVQRDLLSNILYAQMHEATQIFLYGSEYSGGVYFEEKIDPNFCYTITDENGTVYADTIQGQELVCVDAYHFKGYYESYRIVERQDYEEETDVSDSDISDSTDYEQNSSEETHYNYRYYPNIDPENGPITYTITGGIVKNLQPQGRIWAACNLLATVYRYRIAVPILTAIGLFATVLLLVAVCSGAGHKNGDSAIVLNPVDKIPFDVFLTVTVSTSILLFLLFIAMLEEVPEMLLTTAIPIAAVISALIVWTIASLAARLKEGHLIRNLLISRILRWIWKGIKGIWNALARFFAKIPTIPVISIIVGILVVINGIAMLSCIDYNGFTAMLLFIEIPLSAVFTILTAVQIQTVKKGAKAIADGDLTHRIATTGMIGSLKECANDMNRIHEGLNNAVTERMKSEKMKTDLISNVSHDLKTPLTSIINYVDLLNKEPAQTETAKEYLAVLARQSARLKKLTEDIIEASKASSGAISLNIGRCNLTTLLEQAVGEYEERMKQANLETVLLVPDEPVEIWADGQKLWRIFDNLLNNIRKYSKAGTRAYLNLYRENETARIVFRNISEAPLNIPAEELMERFVRGDSSRNSEGSGLGLSIAQGLTELQQGAFELNIDGDLFKVTLTFHLAADVETPQPINTPKETNDHA